MRFDATIAGWSERQRLLFVERLLFWRGTINRRDLCDHFGISLPQATKDLVAYTTLNAGGCHYDVRRKCYVASESMQTVFQEPDFSADVEVIGGAMIDGEERGEFVLGFNRPRRTGNLAVHRRLSLAACRGESVEVTYWSVLSGSGEKRWISPRGFGFDGLRWHTRAFCHKDERFKDFVVGRMQGLGEAKTCPFAKQVDTDWLETEILRFRPHPDLSESQKTALEMDYGMENGAMSLPVRRAMKIYALRRLGFVGEPLEPPMTNELRQLEWVGVDG